MHTDVPMKDIRLSGKEWQNPDNFWDDFLESLGAPEWHGRNLDALHDSIGTGSINKIEVPYRIVVQDVSSLPKSVVFLLYRIDQLIVEMRSDGTPVELDFPDGVPLGWDYVGRRDAFGHMRVLDLLREWDPIGVYGPGSGCPDDEYDSYATGIMALLDRGASAREIAEHLSSIVESSMELRDTDPQRHQATAGHLINVWSGWKADDN